MLSVQRVVTAFLCTMLSVQRVVTALLCTLLSVQRRVTAHLYTMLSAALGDCTPLHCAIAVAQYYSEIINKIRFPGVSKLVGRGGLNYLCAPSCTISRYLYVFRVDFIRTLHPDLD